jgi:hypothetical protein
MQEKPLNVTSALQGMSFVTSEICAKRTLFVMALAQRAQGIQVFTLPGGKRRAGLRT